MQPSTAQKNKVSATQKSDGSVRSRVMAAKSALGLKDLNASAAATGHKLYTQLSSQNPNLQQNQVLNRISPSARKHYMKLSSIVPSEFLSDKIPMNQFRATLNRIKAAQNISKQLNNHYEILDTEQETMSIDESFYPPQMMVLRRTGVRIFPDGRRVALYSNDKLGLVFTVPFKSSGVTDTLPNVTAEEVEVDNLMESLEQVAAYASQENPKSTAKHMKFADGSKMKVSHGAAKAIHMVHGALNDENKKKFAEMLTTPKGFEKAAHFSLSKVNFSIGGK